MNEFEFIMSNLDDFMQTLENHGIIFGWKELMEEKKKDEVKDDNTSE